MAAIAPYARFKPYSILLHASIESNTELQFMNFVLNLLLAANYQFG